MIIRNFTSSELDTKELISMYVDLSTFDNEKSKSYAENVNVLFGFLNKTGSECLIIEKDEAVAGFAIFYPDGKGGVIGQCLYIKKEFRKTLLFPKVAKWLEEYVSSKYDYSLLIATNDYVCSLYEKRNFSKLYTVYKQERS